MNAACSGHRMSYITPPKRYNLSTALRQSWTGTLTGWVFWMWLPLVGFLSCHGADHAGDQLAVSSSGSIPNLCVRSVRWKMMLNTPSHHRVHPGSNPRCSPVGRRSCATSSGIPAGHMMRARNRARRTSSLVICPLPDRVSDWFLAVAVDPVIATR